MGSGDFRDVPILTDITSKTHVALKVIAAEHGITLKETTRQALTYASHSRQFLVALSKLYARRDHGG